jgi:hypothetical protein
MVIRLTCAHGHSLNIDGEHRWRTSKAKGDTPGGRRRRGRPAASMKT